ncbi:DUF5999 family protein, partial [Sphaerisporangium sp. NPDC049002]|uniref:DUF5999 family protein n=1 Tax=Sphaerisporangium sp. NPDC049002 TaxID=3155392 RepID=UPI0033C059C4
MCPHEPSCPSTTAPDREAARTIAAHRVAAGGRVAHRPGGGRAAREPRRRAGTRREL